MNEKVGRNDPCPCGSGKKYKQCCMLKNQPKRRTKLTAKWINAPQGPNLMDRTFGSAIEATGKKFIPVTEKQDEQEKSES